MDNTKSNESIYDGKLFDDENFKLSHSRPYLLSMDTEKANENGSRFYITFKRALQLDGISMVFGEVLSGKDTVDKIN